MHAEWMIPVGILLIEIPLATLFIVLPTILYRMRDEPSSEISPNELMFIQLTPLMGFIGLILLIPGVTYWLGSTTQQLSAFPMLLVLQALSLGGCGLLILCYQYRIGELFSWQRPRRYDDELDVFFWELPLIGGIGSTLAGIGLALYFHNQTWEAIRNLPQLLH